MFMTIVCEYDHMTTIGWIFDIGVIMTTIDFPRTNHSQLAGDKFGVNFFFTSEKSDMASPLWITYPNTLVGGVYTRSEKYEFVNWDDDIPNISGNS